MALYEHHGIHAQDKRFGTDDKTEAPPEEFAPASIIEWEVKMNPLDKPIVDVFTGIEEERYKLTELVKDLYCCLDNIRKLGLIDKDSDMYDEVAEVLEKVRVLMKEKKL